MAKRARSTTFDGNPDSHISSLTCSAFVYTPVQCTDTVEKLNMHMKARRVVKFARAISQSCIQLYYRRIQTMVAKVNIPEQMLLKKKVYSYTRNTKGKQTFFCKMQIFQKDLNVRVARVTLYKKSSNSSIKFPKVSSFLLSEKREN